MALQIPITGVDQGFRVPGNYLEAVFAQGPASAFAPARDVVIVMPKNSAGTWTVNTLYPINSELVAELGAGPGSPLHRCARKFLSTNKTAKLYGVAVAETSGGSPLASSITFTIGGTPTAQGTVYVDFGEDRASFTYTDADDATSIGEGLELAINSLTWIGYTAVNTTGAVAVTAKIKGAAEQVGARAIRYGVTDGTGVTITPGSLVTGVDGTTTEAANLETALATLDATRRYYILTSTNDAAGLDALREHIVNKSLPRQGLRSVGICGSVGVLADAITLATGQNYERLQLVWQPTAELSVPELVGCVAGIRQTRESADSAYNFDNYRAADWIVPPAYAVTDWPTTADLNDAINGGLAPIASNGSGSYLVQSCTTRSKDSTGLVNDPRALQSHRVSVTDEFADELLVNFALNFGNKKLADDERLSDGTVNPNQRLIPGVIRPSMVKGTIQKQLDEYEFAGKTQDAAASKASIRINKVGGRVECGLNLHVIDHLNQTTTLIAEVSTG